MTEPKTMHKLTLKFEHCEAPLMKYEMRLTVENLGLNYESFDCEERLIRSVLDKVFGSINWLYKLPFEFSNSYYITDIDNHKVLLTVSNF